MAKSKKPYFKENDTAGFINYKNKSLWMRCFDALRLVAFADKYPDRVKDFPEVELFIIGLVQISEKFDDSMNRRTEELRLVSFTNELASIYKSFTDGCSLDEQRTRIKDLIYQWKTTLPLSVQDVDQFLLKTLVKSDDIRGSKENAALKVSTHFNFTKNQIYLFENKVKAGGVTAIFSQEYLGRWTSRSVLELILSNMFLLKNGSLLARLVLDKEFRAKRLVKSEK